MTRFFLGTLGALAAVTTAAFGVLSIVGGASASDGLAPEPGAESSTAADSTSPLLAIAIGQLEEDDGSATIDLRANSKRQITLGTLRFYSGEYGYYNGGVREFGCENGVITAKGGGGLAQPDGKRVAVKYTATFDSETGEATVTVKGRGIDYEMEGVVEGLVWCGDPTQAPPSVAA